MNIIKRILNYLSIHRYIFGMNLKNWLNEDEKQYQTWASKQENFKSLYTRKKL
jgi:hypothetical protein